MIKKEENKKPMADAATSQTDGVETENDVAADALATLKELTSDKSELRQNLSLRGILGGDILTGDWLKRQIWLVLLLAVLAVIYITNRYQSQQEMLEMSALKEKLTDLKYDALSRSSELTKRSRQSHIEQFLKTRPDSTLQPSNQAPYVVKNKKR